MIRLIWRFAFVVAAAALFAWLADNPGIVTVLWKGKQITTSVVAGAGFLLLALIVLLFFWNLLRRLWRSPKVVGSFLRGRRNRKAYESLSRGIIAAGAGDAAAAARHAAIAGNALADEPLVNVLAAQAAQLKGDRPAVKRIFEEMTKSPETEALGLRGLFAEARQAGDIATARRHAERALSLNPRLAWASGAMLQLQAMGKDWAGAAATLAQQAKSGLLAAPEAARRRAAMLAAHAIKLEEREPVQALEAATSALKLDPGLVPAALVAARLHIANGSPRKAARYLRECWSRAPHPDIAEVHARQKPGEGPEARLERVRDLVGDPAGNIEAGVALARAAVAAQRWDLARTSLEPFTAGRPEARICALMAEIEEGQGDKGRAREWLARAVTAPRDPMWVSDGVAAHRWTPTSPVSGEIVTAQWKTPYEMPELTPQRAAETEVPVLAPVPAVELAAEPPKPAERPRAVEAFRPPDDPGVGEAVAEPEAAARRSLAAEG
ncbi:MAG: heme biosynthesis protein HemY [Rhizobiales bacterium]|nr:heme biosynthesis protein HemY [Hyphomicrobiales bacterium]